jgi:hypothetical protein
MDGAKCATMDFSFLQSNTNPENWAWKSKEKILTRIAQVDAPAV